MATNQVIKGLQVDEVIDRIRRDLVGTDDSVALNRIVVLHKTKLPPDRWTEILSSVAQSIGLKTSYGEGTLDEAAEWAMPDLPVVLSFGEGTKRRFVILHDHFGSRIQATLGPSPFASTWISRRELEQRLELERDQRTIWLAFAPSTPGAVVSASEQNPARSEPNAHQSSHAHTSQTRPLTRLLQIIRPEMKDIRVIGIYALATSVLGLATPLAVEALVATVGFRMLMQQVFVLTLVLFCFLSLAAALFTVQKYVVEVIQRRIFVRIVADFAFRLPRVPASAFDHHNGPELMNRFFDVMTIQKTLSGLLTDGIYLIITTVLGLSVMGFYHPYLLGFDIVLLACITGIILILGRGGVATSIQESRAKYNTAGWLEELARLPITLKHFQGKELALERADGLARSYLDARRNHFKIVYRQILFSVILQVFASTTLLGLGGWLVIRGQLTLGQLVASELIVAMVVGSFAKLGKYIEDFYDLLAAADKLGHIIDLPIESDSGDLLPHTSQPISVIVEHAVVRDDHHHVMAGPVSFVIQAGEKVALSGPGGSGKSTVLAMLARHRIASEGRVSLDGLDIRDIWHDSLREQVSLVFDESPLQGTVIENIRMGRDSLSLQEVRWALDVVGLAEKFSETSNGLYSEIGPNGHGISKGEAQRLLIARSIVAKPRLLLIDGQLDGLDGGLRQSIMNVLIDESAPWTLILVTQCESVISRMNRTISLDKVHESSSHSIAIP
jgi:ABC-type bacteriocin/lantibiotic exporter with double-glycine peptidase domain